jgi:plastocyanin
MSFQRSIPKDRRGVLRHLALGAAGTLLVLTGLTSELAAAPSALRSMSSIMHVDHASHIQAMAEEEPDTVVLKNFHFAPVSFTVTAGTTVTWKNLDEEPHTVVAVDGLFRSGALDEGDSFAFKFDKPGTYRFICSIHPQMMGTIVVQ